MLIILGVTSIGVYGIALAGWSSNSKYSLLGALRASAQMISYELALGLSLVGVIMTAQTLSLRGIVDQQAGGILSWNFFGGLQFKEIAEVLGVSEVTVRRRWTAARAWLKREVAA